MAYYKDIPKGNILKPLFHKLEAAVRECDTDIPLIVLRIQEIIESVERNKDTIKTIQLLEDILNNESIKFSKNCDCLKFDLNKKKFYTQKGRIYSITDEEAEADLKRMMKKLKK